MLLQAGILSVTAVHRVVSTSPYLIQLLHPSIICQIMSYQTYSYDSMGTRAVSGSSSYISVIVRLSVQANELLCGQQLPYAVLTP